MSFRQSNEQDDLLRKYMPLYLLALLLVGIGYLAVTPPFEGFDEYAHYSSMRQIAYTGTIPISEASYVDRACTDYQGPGAYSSLNPPFDQGMVYSKFFARPDLIEHYRLAYRELPSPTPFQPSHELNGEAQHPPLYYLLLAPVVRLVSDFSFVTQIFVLRFVSFLIALIGVALGLLAVRQSKAPHETDQSVIGFLLYPIILPMFFPEFTRIGNDALCIFLVGGLALLLSAWRRDERSTKLSLAIGVTLGLGLLTKAFFLPITAALAAFLSVRLWRQHQITRAGRWKSLLLIVLPALLIGGGWYVYKLVAFGELSGGNDAIVLARQGGLVAGLRDNFSLYALARGVVATFVSYSWAGTWSLTRLPALFHMPLLMLAVLVFGAYAFQLKHQRMTDFAWLPVWLFVFFGAGLFYHVLISVAINGNGNTPGWYLHILMPLVAPAIGAGVCSLLKTPRAKPFVIGLLLYAVVFQTMALWSQFALFTGCATKGDDKYYAFSGHAFCLDQIPLLTDRLSVIGWPVLATIGFGSGVLCALWLLMRYLLSPCTRADAAGRPRQHQRGR